MTLAISDISMFVCLLSSIDDVKKDAARKNKDKAEIIMKAKSN
jgi:hypothetical protein